ncbi:MAG: hypothetical protein DDG59_00715 [Anaerolineae bacterium]|jgi:alkaline phosphatase|nr:MAG: hypothetical protein DDG59_00715 [Anaerolineae bacterium]
MNILLFLLVLPFIIAWLMPSQQRTATIDGILSPPRYVILFIGDGMGENHLLATQQYTHKPPPYQNQSWYQGWVSTYPEGGIYDPNRAWSEFDWVRQNAITDSAAAANSNVQWQKNLKWSD